MSLITHESDAMLDRYQRGKRMQEFGASLYGPNLSRWPARVVDALDVIETERIREENAREEARD